ncbi:MAG TPA: hypothetical protein VJ910_01055, partial [Desulfuromonadales bacterium]|nr:hypothetical protein [Desulfuromonadales bacterium]
EKETVLGVISKPSCQPRCSPEWFSKREEHFQSKKRGHPHVWAMIFQEFSQLSPAAREFDEMTSM